MKNIKSITIEFDLIDQIKSISDLPNYNEIVKMVNDYVENGVVVIITQCGIEIERFSK